MTLMVNLPKEYDSKAVDPKWRNFWKASSLFRAESSSAKPPFCVVIPPPNVTGVLHMGHAFVSSLIDAFARWKRMNGYNTLIVPGTDHAGIATQTVVERHLFQKEGKRRTDYTREQFLEHVWQWKEQCETTILSQIEMLGCSCDWSRLRFTMDEGNNRAVKTMFKRLFDQGLIYRGQYLVNWDPVSQTALADDEVEYEERESSLWYIRYPSKNGQFFITVATTRPETLLGDTAVAVSPKDPRYAHWVGEELCLPLTQRTIPIIADPYVDPSFGTGAVKITPAHDPNDYQIGLRHHLPMINILTADGKINEEGGAFQGLHVETARSAVVQALQQQQLLEKKEMIRHSVGMSYRSKAVVEPRLSEQWFVRMEKFKERLRACVEKGRVKLIPAHWDRTYFQWIDHLRDWCISRQLWWGHQIPIWTRVDDPTQMICSSSDEPPPEVLKDPEAWKQDPDVLDTWFSSALWPFSTLGWPNTTQDLATFYPNSTLITGHDILFFWVARMLAFGEEAMGLAPFPEVFLHGLIYGKSYWRQRPEGGILYVPPEERLDYDLGKPLPQGVFSKWEKMSKSKGNVIDPIEMIEIYGTDAVRMALCASATHARQIDLDRRRFEEFKNFANKIWNGARFVFLNLDGQPDAQLPPLQEADVQRGIQESLCELEDRWILCLLEKTVRDVNKHFTHYEFDQATMKAYDFFWKELCAYYLEIGKPVLFGKRGSPEKRAHTQLLLLIVLCQAIRLIHPIAPFISEELFEQLRARCGSWRAPHADPYTQECLQALQAKACAVSSFPQPIDSPFSWKPEQVFEEFETLEDVIRSIRNLRAEMQLPPSQSTDLYLVGPSHDQDLATLVASRHMMSALIKVSQLHIQTTPPQLPCTSTAVYRALQIVLPLPPERIEQERARLSKEHQKLLDTLQKLRSQLENEDFIRNAPEQLVTKQKKLLEQKEKEIAELQHKLAQL